MFTRDKNKARLRLNNQSILLCLLSQLKGLSLSNLSIFSLYYAETCNEFAVPISVRVNALLRPGDTVPLEEMSQRWRAVFNTVSDLTGQDLNFRPPAPATNALPVGHLIGFRQFDSQRLKR